MSEFNKVAELSEISNPGKELIELDDQIVVLFHVDGNYYCLDDVCTHDGGTLGDGELTGTSIACPRHGAKFDICSGKALTMPATEDTTSHYVEVREDGVYVKLREEQEDAANPTTEPNSVSSPNPAPTAASTAASSPSATEPTSAATAETSQALEFATLSEDVVREQLKKVIDPELFVNIVDLGLIYNVELQELEAEQTNVTIEMTMTSPACPAGPQLIANSKQVVGQLKGVADVEVKIVMDPPWTPDKMTDDAKDQLGIF